MHEAGTSRRHLVTQPWMHHFTNHRVQASRGRRQRNMNGGQDPISPETAQLNSRFQSSAADRRQQLHDKRLDLYLRRQHQVTNGGYVSSDDDSNSKCQQPPSLVNKTPRQIFNLISDNRIKEGDMLDKNKCLICLDSFREILTDQRELMVTKCGHVFCKPCTFGLLQSTRPSNAVQCSVCRRHLRKTHDFSIMHLPLFNLDEIKNFRQFKDDSNSATSSSNY